MTAEPDLPINDAVPAPTKIEPGNLFLWNWRQMQVYAQACVAHATAAKDAEVETLRAEVERLQGYVHEADRRVGEQFMAAQDANAHRLRALHDRLLDVKRAEAAEARAERLAEALREAEEYIDAVTPAWASKGQRVLDTIRAALHPTAAQEGE